MKMGILHGTPKARPRNTPIRRPRGILIEDVMEEFKTLTPGPSEHGSANHNGSTLHH